MIGEDEVYVVTKIEHHLLRTCPCDRCGAERERRAVIRSFLPPPKHPIHSLSVRAARVLGYVGPGLPEGSLARRMMMKKRTQ